MTFDLAFFAAAVPAIILVGLAKGGFAGIGLLSLPLMSLVMSPITAATIMLPLLLVQDCVSVWTYRREFSRKNVLTLLPGGVLGVAAGYFLAARVSDAAIGLAVGLITFSFALRRMVLSRAVELPATRPSFAAGTVWGGLAGFTSMIAHAGGPPFQIYVMPQRLPPTSFVGTGAIFFALVNVMKVPPYIALGQFTPANMTAAAALLPVAVASTFAGVWLVRRIPAERFYAVIYWLLLAVGAKLIFDGVRGLWLV